MKLWRYGQAVEYLGRRYRLDGMLGSGGMADVCLAWDEREQREVALKILKSDDLDQETLNRFMKEAAQIADWQHPHILRIYESLQVELIDATNGSVLFYMVSEYARGGDLQKRLTPGRPFPLSASFALFRQLCDAVQYAHEHGVIHRDLKPLNMLFRRPESGPEEVVLSDFGLAVQVEASHYTFAHGGTLAYMAPEQFQGKALPASDIFALGVILYVLCTGGLPFRRTLRDIPRVVQGQAPVPTRPSLINPELPPALDDVLLRAMRELPAERYRQPREFWEAIELVLTLSARTFPFVDDFWQNAGQTWPYDGSGQPQRFRQAGQQRQLPGPSSFPAEETPEVEEGSVSALWIAREKQKASPVRHPLPTNNSILMSPNLAEDDASDVLPSERGASPTWQPGDQLLASGERQSYRRQPFEPPGTFTADPEHQTSHRRASHPRPDATERQTNRRQPPALPAEDLETQSSRWRTSKRAGKSELASSYDASGLSEDEAYPSSQTRATPAPRERQAIARRFVPNVSANASNPASVPARRARVTPNTSPQPARRVRGTAQHPWFSPRAQTGTRRRLPLMVILCGLLALGLLLAILAATTFQGPLLTFFGAPITRVTLQPRAQLVQETAVLSVSTTGGQLAPNEIPGRQLTVTSSTQSAVANATGSTQGKRATGLLTFINNGPTTITLQSVIITGNSGIPISFNGPITIPAIPPTIAITGFAVNPGNNGNIPAFDITKSCCAANIVVKNTSAFTGGQDGQQNSIIEQKDIDGAARSLVVSGQGQAQAALQKQILPNERVAGDAQCQPQINADQQVGARAKQATVQVAVTCSESVYDYNAASQFFARDLQRRASADPELAGAYALQGQIALTQLATTPAPAGGSASTALQFHAQGLWVYQFKPATLRSLANLIAGKSQNAARALLLQQPGISGAQFSGSGSLPVNTSEIQLHVQETAP